MHTAFSIAALLLPLGCVLDILNAMLHRIFCCKIVLEYSCSKS